MPPRGCVLQKIVSAYIKIFLISGGRGSGADSNDKSAVGESSHQRRHVRPDPYIDQLVVMSPRRGKIESSTGTKVKNHPFSNGTRYGPAERVCPLSKEVRLA